jgi:hypothetical protein
MKMMDLFITKAAVEASVDVNVKALEMINKKTCYSTGVIFLLKRSLP